VADPDYEVAIIGAGPGGIAAAKLLRDKDITDFIILERDPDFGGTWRDNHYPGLAVDIPVLWYPADLIVLATGYELWTDPETYRHVTTLGDNGFDLAQYYRAEGLRSYSGTAQPATQPRPAPQAEELLA
jgi:phytoene dehydrogenase-like protein